MREIKIITVPFDSNNGIFDDEAAWKADTIAFFNRAIPALSARGLLYVPNFGYMATHPEDWDELEALAQPPVAAMEEAGFVKEYGPETFNYHEWRQKLEGMARLERLAVLMTCHGKKDDLQRAEGLARMDLVGSDGSTGWQALWFGFTSFLLALNEDRSNGWFGFTVWGYCEHYWFDEFDPTYLHLGDAVAPYEKTGEIYFREFHDGWVAVNPSAAAVTGVAVPRGEARVLDHDTFKSPEQAPLVDRFDLGAHRGVILLKPGRLVGNQDNSPSCSGDLRDCDGDPGNGCETDISSDPGNCGACGESCSPGAACRDGECRSVGRDGGVDAGADGDGTSPAAAAPKAFPCAQGFGAAAVGGRGGDVYHVTSTLDDGEPGTLRHAVEAGPRPLTVVFDTGGVIWLDSLLRIRRGQITIAGQTAPGGGITIAAYPFGVSEATDVIIRYLRVSLGDYNACGLDYPTPCGPDDPGRGNHDLWAEGGDPIIVHASRRVILDHVSVSWSMDELVDLWGSKDVTIQHSILAEALYDSYHPKGPHSMALMLVQGAVDADELAAGLGGLTAYGNLLAHNNWRNPLVSGRGDERAIIDVRNNVIYDWGRYAGHQSDPPIDLNYIGNYLVAGPSTEDVALDLVFQETNAYEGVFNICFVGNYLDSDRNSVHDGTLAGESTLRYFEPEEILADPFPWPELAYTLPAPDAYDAVLSQAGASLVRDEVDLRIVEQVRTRTGRIIDSQDEVGGVVELPSGTPPVDSDGDGMPDGWELDRGLDPDDPSDRNGYDLVPDGYTNLEVYLDSIVAAAGHCSELDHSGGTDAGSDAGTDGGGEAEDTLVSGCGCHGVAGGVGARAGLPVLALLALLLLLRRCYPGG